MFERSGQKKSEAIAALDIGTKKVACIIAVPDDNFGMRMIGKGIAASRGMKAGAVTDMAAVEEAIRSAVGKAERMAGVAVQAVSVNVGNRSLRSDYLNVQTEFASGEVADRDLKRVLGSSLSEFSQPEYVILHALPQTWSVDNENGIRDPRGMFGKKLGVDMHFVLSSVGPLRNLAHCIDRRHLNIRNVLASPYAAGLSVLTADEKDLGSMVIDMGGGVTSMSIFRDNTLVYTDAIALGGHNVTNDIARVLMTPPEAAERIKLLYGSALRGMDNDQDIVPCPPMGAQDELHEEPRSLLNEVINARIVEIFQHLRARLEKKGMEHYCGRRIVLTGGGANLNGARELAEQIFNKRVRIGVPHGIMGLGDHLSRPEFAVVTGLLLQDHSNVQEAISGPPDLSGQRYRSKRYNGSGFTRSLKWLRDNF